MVDLPVFCQLVHGDLHQFDDLLANDTFLLAKLARGALEDIDVGIGDWVEGAALDQNRAFAEGRGGLQHLSLRAEHRGVG